MPFAHVRDLSVYYELHGSGDPVLNISGTGGDLRANPLRSHGVLEQNFEVLMYDQRGLGQTSKPSEAYTMAEYADDAVALMDELGWARAHVVGTSFGGMVAQHVVLRHPDRVNRLVLACTSAGGEGGDSFDLLAVADLAAEERFKVTLPILDTRNDPRAKPPVYAPMFAELVTIMMSRPPLNSDDPSAAIGARRQLEARRDHNTWVELASVAAPTLVIGGTYDMQAPPENLRRLAERIPGATLVFCDGGHLFMLQDPTAWPTIVAFLQPGA